MKKKKWKQPGLCSRLLSHTSQLCCNYTQDFGLVCWRAGDRPQHRCLDCEQLPRLSAGQPWRWGGGKARAPRAALGAVPLPASGRDGGCSPAPRRHPAASHRTGSAGSATTVPTCGNPGGARVGEGRVCQRAPAGTSGKSLSGCSFGISPTTSHGSELSSSLAERKLERIKPN